MITTDLQLDANQTQALRERWNEQAKSLQGGTPILESGLKVQPCWSAPVNKRSIAMDIAHYSKAIVAAVMAVLLIIEAWTGWKSEAITEEWIITILAVIGPILVWLVPNTPATPATATASSST